MQHNLDDLAKCNDYPSDEAISEVKGLLSKPWKRLEETNAEINRLEVLLKKLKQTRTGIEGSMNRYSSILAPIRRVPEDILQMIFIHCLPTHRNPTMGASNPPMLLTRICRRWRSIAFSLPILWARIHIPFRIVGDIHPQHPGYLIVPAHTVSTVLQHRCQAVADWLTRSGDCPLSISITCLKDYHHDCDFQPETSILLLKIVAKYAPRWAFMQLKIPLETYRELETILSSCQLPMLVRLRADISDEASDVYWRPSLGLLESRNLQFVSLRLPYSWGARLQVLAQRLQLHQNITYLSIPMPCPVDDVIRLLRSCPRINYLRLSLERYELQHKNLQVVLLPCLRYLMIEDDFAVSQNRENIYSFLICPQLQWIDWRNPSIIGQFSFDDPPGSSILSLVERVVTLNRLAFTRQHLSPSQVHRLLDMVPVSFITKLILRSVLGNWEDVDTFDLGILIGHHKSETTATVTDKILLPRLEHFELYQTRVPDDTVLQFVLSRTGTIPSISILKYVKIVFSRMKIPGHVDVEDHVRMHLAQTSIKKIHLELNYLLPLYGTDSEIVDPLSPNFIGDQTHNLNFNTGDKTWTLEEMDDEIDIP
uniref:F-box domain-containing protein n=1 Tax=Psilocybe cubensis TaxID=181762 RepID=A0A8H7XSV9_PSICU